MAQHGPSRKASSKAMFFPCVLLIIGFSCRWYCCNVTLQAWIHAFAKHTSISVDDAKSTVKAWALEHHNTLGLVPLDDDNLEWQVLVARNVPKSQAKPTGVPANMKQVC